VSGRACVSAALLCASAAGCATTTSGPVGSPTVIDPAVAAVAVVDAADAAMAEAASAAQRSLPLFRRRLEQERGLEAVYGVRIVDDGATVWLESVQFRGDTVSGLVDGAVDGAVDGPRVRTVSSASIIDWVIVDHDGIHGGYTLRLERARLTPDEQRVFDRELGAVFLPLP
jgi:hypothetical protein